MTGNMDEEIAEVLIAYRRGAVELVPSIERIRDLLGAPADARKRLTAEVARKWVDANGTPGQRPEPSVILKHFRAQGYEVPSARTIRRWFEDYDKRQAEAAAS